MIEPVNSVQPDPINQVKSFRLWVDRLWMENREERLIYCQDPVTIKEYWNTYKYWLKREYKYQRSKND